MLGQLHFGGRGVGVVGIVVGDVVALEQREEALDGGDDDVAVGGHVGRTEAVDGIFGAERVARLRDLEFAELVVGLLAEVVAVDEEENAPHGREGEEAIGGEAGCIGLACTRGEHHQRTPTAVAERGFELGDGFVLAVAQSFPPQGGKSGKRIVDAQRAHQLPGRGQRALVGFEVFVGDEATLAIVLEIGHFAIGRDAERQGHLPRLIDVGRVAGVAVGLVAHSFVLDVDFGTLRFEDADSLAASEEHVVGTIHTLDERFADGYGSIGRAVVLSVYNLPARLFEHLVNLQSCFLFWFHRWFDAAKIDIYVEKNKKKRKKSPLFYYRYGGNIRIWLFSFANSINKALGRGLGRQVGEVFVLCEIDARIMGVLRWCPFKKQPARHSRARRTWLMMIWNRRKC